MQYCPQHFGGRDHGPDAASAGVVRAPAGTSQTEFNQMAAAYLDAHPPLPNVPSQLLTNRIEDMGFDTEQEGVAVFSDYHFGGLIDPRVSGGIGGFDVATARSRLNDWANGVLRFTQMTQTHIRVRVLHILALGDDMEGNGHMFPTQSLQMEMPVYFQYLGFVEDMTDVLIRLLMRYETIHIYKVFGNHGRIAARAKDNYDPDNIELMAWHTIAERCERLAPGRFTFDISSSFFQLIRIQGFSFLIRHGDGMNLHSTYTGVMDNKLAMNSIVGEVINYMIIGHHHTASEREEEISGDIISNGCFAGPSLLAMRMKRPRANRPSQEIFFVHPRRGITHHYRIHLAEEEEVRRPQWIGYN